MLGGGGHLGAHGVGMLRALVEHGVRPDLVLGTSVGAINGAVIAADPTPDTAARLAEAWSGDEDGGVFGGSLLGRIGTLARSRTHLHENTGLRRMLEERLPVRTFDELAVPFQCVAASIERAAEHWFADGPLIDAVLASSAVPGLLPPVEIGGEHFVDGGVVNSIPVGRAVGLGAHTIYVLQVGRLDSPLRPPEWPWEVALVTFEIARRHRFLGDLVALPEGVELHLLPTGDPDPPRFNDISAQLRYRDFGSSGARIERARAATARYLSEQAGGPPV